LETELERDLSTLRRRRIRVGKRGACVLPLPNRILSCPGYLTIDMSLLLYRWWDKQIKKGVSMNIGRYSIEGGEIVIRLPIKPVRATVDHRRVILSSTHGRESFIHAGNLIHVNANVWVGDAVEFPESTGVQQAPVWAVGEVSEVNKRIREGLAELEQTTVELESEES